MQTQTQEGLNQALEFLENGKPFEARKIISKLFETEIDCPELIFTNRCCVFWADYQKNINVPEDYFSENDFSRSGFIENWKSFKTFMANSKPAYENAFYAVKKGYFSTVLKACSECYEKVSAYKKNQIMLYAGICYKQLGNFENAKDCFTDANNEESSANTLALLADCYSHCGDDTTAKILFREAFYLDAESIDLEFLDSAVIKSPIRKTEEKGLTGRIQKLWIPIYGILYGVFDKKRELSAQEAGTLRQNIYAMENEFKTPTCDSDAIIPKLLNCYFRLIDHYNATGESISKINEVITKIRVLDSEVYEIYKS